MSNLAALAIDRYRAGLGETYLIESDSTTYSVTVHSFTYLVVEWSDGTYTANPL